MKVLKGLPVCRGIAIGKIYKFSSEPLRDKTLLQKLSKEFHDLDLKDIGRIKVLRNSLYEKVNGKENIENQVKEFKLVIKKSTKDLESARKKLSEDISEKFSEIIDFQILALKDSNIFNKTIDLIREYKISAYLAVSIIFNERIELLRKNNKKKFRNRTYDLVDLYNRLVSYLKTADTDMNGAGADGIDKDLILVSRRMFPTDLAKIDLKKVRGIVIEK
jgi:phosphoenolpyruvate-protein kinase (PTS system EI component)